MDEIDGYIAGMVDSETRSNLEQSYLENEPPEQAAERLRKARTFDVPVQMVGTITPEEEAKRWAELANVEALREQAPVLSQSIRNPAVLNLVRHDLDRQGLIETLIWKLAPEGGPADSFGGRMRNAVMSGVYGLFTDFDRVNDLTNQIKAIEQGELNYVVDEYGLGHVVNAGGDTRVTAPANADKEATLAYLRAQLEEAEVATAWAKDMQSLYPGSEDAAEFSKKESAGDVVSYLMEHPAVALELGLSSSVQNLPAIMAMVATAGAGSVLGAGKLAQLLLSMAATGATSYGLDKEAGFGERLSDKSGLDFTKFEELRDFFADPANAKAISEAFDKARLHATAVAGVDALSAGLASKTMLPKFLLEKVGESMAKKELVNLGVQTPIQGLMGGAGEALGQLAADQKITSWADIVAEIVGEGLTAPVEVATSSYKIYREGHALMAKAEQNAKLLDETSKNIAQSEPDKLESPTMDAIRTQTAAMAGVETVEIDADALFQMDGGDRFKEIQEIAEQLEARARDGGKIEVPLNAYVKRVLPLAEEIGKAEELKDIAAPKGQASKHEARILLDNARRTAKYVFSEEAQQAEANRRHSSARVGGQIEKELKAVGVSKQEARAVASVMQAAVTTLARQLGVDPEALWQASGARAVKASSGSPSGVRGAFQLDEEGKRVIAVTQGRNKSTAIHEYAHLLLAMHKEAAFAMIAEHNKLVEEARAKATDPDKFEEPKLPASQEAIIQNYAEIAQWLTGTDDPAKWAAMTKEQKEEAEERFARSFEQYIREAGPTTSAVKKAFRTLARFLQAVYQLEPVVPGSLLDDNARLLIGRLFRADVNARDAMIRVGIRPLFVSAEASGMSKAWCEAYFASINESHGMAQDAQRARQEALYQLIEEQRKKIREDIVNGTPEAKRIRAEVTKEVEKEKETRAFQAWDAFTNGRRTKGKDGHADSKIKVRFIIEELKQLGVDPDTIKALRDHHFAQGRNSKGKPPLNAKQTVAALGYPNLNELISDLLEHPHYGGELVDKINAKVEERMMAENPVTPSMERQIEQATADLFNDAYITAVSLECNALENRVNSETRVEKATYDELAYNEVAQMTWEMITGGVRQKGSVSAVQAHMRAAITARRNAEKAFRKGDIVRALFLKRQELRQTTMARALKEAMSEHAADLKSLRRYKKKEIKQIDGRYLEAIKQALAAMHLYEHDQLHINPLSPETDFSNIINGLRAEDGIVIDLPAELLAALNTSNGEYLNTVAGFRAFMDLVHDLDHYGRQAQQIRTLEGAKQLEEIETEGGKIIRDNAAKRGRSAPDNVEREGSLAKAVDFLKTFSVNHVRAQQLLQGIEGRTDGFFFDTVLAPTQRAGDTEATLKNKYTVALAKILGPVMKGLQKDEPRTSEVFKQAFGVEDCAFSRKEVFYMALNFGNAGNRERLLYGLKGDKRTGHNEVTEAQMLALFSEYLTEADFAAVQSVWDTFADMQKETDKVTRRIMGRPPVWVQPSAFEALTADGKKILLKGGYYPIVYDRKASGSGQKIASAQDLKSMTPVFGASGVDDGHLQERVSDVRKHDPRPLALTAEALASGLDQQIHYVAWAEWTNSMRKIFDPNREIMKAIRDTWGAEYCDVISRWIGDCRDGASGKVTPLDGLANILRKNLSLAGLGFNPMTAIVQPIGILQSIVRIGGDWCAKGMSEYLRMGPAKAAAFAEGKSAFMADRSRTAFRELAEIQVQLAGQGELKDKFMRAAYKPIVVMQMLVDVPTWLGAYQKALAEGNSEEKAVLLADRAVKDAQGSGSFHDLSEFERSGAFAKLMTVFYNFFNTALQLIMISGHTKEGYERIKAILTICVLQPVLETFLRSALSALGASGGDDDEDDDWAFAKKLGGSIISFNLGLLVGVREMSGLFGDYDKYSGPSGLRKIGDVFTLTNQLGREEWDDATLRAAISVLGSWCGVPAAEINRFIKAANDDEKQVNPIGYLLGY